MAVVPLETLAAIEPLLAAGSAAFVFKHSTRCPTSARARVEVDRFAHDHPDVPVHRVLVVEHRPISLAVADRLGVPHQSPQAILVRDGRAVWNASHGGVNAAALAEAWTA
jgi:bacillithiol system protein YtxJ